MTNENKLKIGLALNHIAMVVSMDTLVQIKPWLNKIETIVAEEPTEEDDDNGKDVPEL